MPAKTIFFALVCLAPLPLAADDAAPNRADRYTSHRQPGGMQRAPRPLAPAESTRDQRVPAPNSGDVEPASYAVDRESPVEAPAPRTLPPRSRKSLEGKAPAGGARRFGSASSIITSMASLVVVLTLFFGVAWALRRGMPAPPPSLPADAVEVLGRTALAGRQHAHLVRCGNKILLVYLSSGVAETLTEITDPLEVDRLTGLCRRTHPQSATKSFRQLLQQFGREKVTPGFLEQADPVAERGFKGPRPRGGNAGLEDADA